MNDELSAGQFDFAVSDARAGFRLQRFEVYNWGTFDKRVWVLEPNGENSLVTGDIGSGKSTLVDALTTLLVPANRITYNKAAGADTRERTLRSYVLGHYKSERTDAGFAAKAVPLRDHNSYSVILGHFYNEGYDRHVTLAQVFWFRDTQGQPARFHVVADRPLSITGDFSGFGAEIKDLRKRLRAARQVEIFDSFPPYGAAFRRRFGIGNEQALELFNQTVSLKSVGNLTEFVRGHMLEPFAVEDRIQQLIAHFDDLDRAHRAVQKAREQIEALDPLVADATRHAEVTEKIEELRTCREALRPWFAHLKSELLGERIERLDAEIGRLAAKLANGTAKRRELEAERDEVRRAISDNGGDRLERLKAEIERLAQVQVERRQRADAYNELARATGFSAAGSEAQFTANRREIERLLAEIGTAEAELQNRMTEALVNLRGLESRRQEHEVEIASLRERRSNVPAAMLALRERLCTDLALDPEELPFAGELLQVRDGENDWAGAIERLLHNFGLSLLVPDPHYRAVAEWVDRTHLRGRLVYFRVTEQADRSLPVLRPASLVRKLSIRPDSGFYGWLESELARRFDYACCADLEQFRREHRAVTRAGQVKAGGQRHEKDDRHAIDDVSRYVLGWDNAAKVAALRKLVSDLERQVETAARRHAKIQQEHRELREREVACSKLAVFQSFSDLDWRTPVRDVERLEEERNALEAASDVLRTLQQQLDTVGRRLAALDEALQKTSNEHAIAGEKRDAARQSLSEAQVLLDATPEEGKARWFPVLEKLRPEALGEHRLTVESCDNRQMDMRDWLQAKIDAEEKRRERLGVRIIDGMRRYKNAWPVETTEVDVSIEAAGEYRSILEQLRADDLPRFESRFKELLNENTIREVANFQAQLNREREEIRERIETINRSLHGIDYNTNRYICLLAEPAQDQDIRELRESLRACTEGALTGSEDEQYSEAKFLQVQAIIERFRGREGQSDADLRWTRKVTDVRNWFLFSASERWREDDAEYEHYTDSGGKSGGQKEKLAYTVLAASLAYQFGLEWGEQRSRSFRFVVIDEAFGRGSDESTRYGLELFRKLNLQLLIVTPLQKIHVIDPYVANVGFVHNEDGKHSLLRNLTIAEYRAERAARRMISVS
ncbi:MAG TPA: SbcC/MukB-like Walker B domain-containing protein [Woeseiaceae bacterium]